MYMREYIFDNILVYIQVFIYKTYINMYIICACTYM